MKSRSRTWPTTRAFTVWAICFICLVSGARRGFGADLPAYTEYQVKALCLLNFAKYVDWPSETFAATNSPITVGVIGENKFGNDLKDAMAGRCIDGRKITVMPIASEEDWHKCQILFISASEKRRQAEIVKRLKSWPVLTVGESDQSTPDGVVINFMKKDDKVRFEVDLNAAREAGLGISSKLLSLADTVRGKP